MSRHVSNIGTLAICLVGAGASGFVACSSSTPRDGFSGDGNGDAGAGAEASSSSSGGLVVEDDSGSKPPVTNGCSDDAKLVYVLSLEGDLYSFEPAAKKFNKVGPLNCKAGNTKLVPVSMAVDREAVAWVNMREDSLLPTRPDELFRVDTKTAACTPSGITARMGGMGFATDDGASDKETLYIDSSDENGLTSGLYAVDFAQKKLGLVANFKEPSGLELTGTGEGKLFGFVVAQQLSLVEVNKKTAAFSSKVSLPNVQLPQAPMYAFSHWGGDFYFYTAKSPAANTTTTVARYRPSDGSIDPAYMTSIGFHIVGAGVSTCAPTTQPK
jgi:hypothetical protein